MGAKCFSPKGSLRVQESFLYKVLRAGGKRVRSELPGTGSLSLHNDSDKCCVGGHPVLPESRSKLGLVWVQDQA